MPFQVIETCLEITLLKDAAPPELCILYLIGSTKMASLID